MSRASDDDRGDGMDEDGPDSPARERDEGRSEPPQRERDEGRSQPPEREEGEWEALDEARWPLHPGGLLPRERWMWFETLWQSVCLLRERYRLPVRAGWWEDPVQTEALAAFTAWADRYDSGEWDDPPGKLALLYDIERLSAMLRDGREPFHPERDRTHFLAHLIQIGCHPPPFAR